MGEPVFADGANYPAPGASSTDLEAIVRHWLTLAEERLAGPIAQAIRARDLPGS